MLKSEAVELLGRDMSAAAELVGISYQAVKKWPDELPPRIADRVLGVCVRKGIHVPARFLEPNQPQAPANQARVATETVAQAVQSPAAINSEALHTGQEVAHV